MTEVQYGVVQQNGAWTIIGENLRFGSYQTRKSAVRAALRLAKESSGLRVALHVQDEKGELRPATRVA